MKKIMCVLFAAIMIFSLSSCMAGNNRETRIHRFPDRDTDGRNDRKHNSKDHGGGKCIGYGTGSYNRCGQHGG